MSLLANLKPDVVVKESVDTVGRSGPVASGIYPAKITMAYLGESTGGAASLTLHMALEGAGELRQTIYMSSGKAKGQKTTYTKDGVNYFLPGYEQALHLGLLTCGKEPHDWTAEEKVVSVWNSSAKAEQPTKVQVVTDLMGQEVLVGVMNIIDDKNVKDASGNYVPTGETRAFNEVEKFFRAADRMTVVEIRAQTLTTGEFIDKWAEKFTDTVKDISKGTKAAGPAAATAFGTAPAAGAAPKPETSLFATPAAA